MFVDERLFIEAGPNLLESLYSRPAGKANEAFVLCHPYPPLGGTMFNKVIVKLSSLLLDQGYAVLRYNMRGTGKSTGTMPEPMGSRQDLEYVLDWLDREHPVDGIWLAGYSYGAFMALSTQVPGLAGSFPGRFPVKGMLAVAYPATLPEYRLKSFPEIPVAFIHGMEDELIPASAMASFLSTLDSGRPVEWIEGANHSFDGKLGDLQAACLSCIHRLKN
ncbi:MAG: alpha/beta hydrolase [Planctomycetota bacterium]|jgi:alpha/beta superfamily hydrolase